MSRVFCRMPAGSPYDGRLSNAEFRVLAIICAQCDNDTDEFDKSNAWIGKCLNVSVRSVRSAISRLVDMGWIRRFDEPGKKSKTIVNFDHDPGSSDSGVGGPDPGSPGSGVEPDPGSPASYPPEAQLPGTPEAQLPPILDSESRLFPRERASPSAELEARPSPARPGPAKSFSRSHRVRRVPAPQMLPREWWGLALKACPGVDTDHEFDLFRAHYVGLATEAEWRRRWGKWFRNGIPKKLADETETPAERDISEQSELFKTKAIEAYERHVVGSKINDSRDVARLKVQAWPIFKTGQGEFGLERFGIWTATQLIQAIEGKPMLVVAGGSG